MDRPAGIRDEVVVSHGTSRPKPKPTKKMAKGFVDITAPPPPSATYDFILEGREKLE